MVKLATVHFDVVDQVEGDLIHLGCQDHVFYLDEINWTDEFQDVFLISNSGKRFGFNRCMVACLRYRLTHITDCLKDFLFVKLGLHG